MMFERQKASLTLVGESRKQVLSHSEPKPRFLPQDLLAITVFYKRGLPQPPV